MSIQYFKFYSYHFILTNIANKTIPISNFHCFFQDNFFVKIYQSVYQTARQMLFSNFISYDRYINILD